MNEWRDLWYWWIQCEEAEADLRATYRWLLEVRAPFEMLLAQAGVEQ